MNIFALHLDPKIAAKHHCDKHVVKMILESSQMISTVFDKYKAHQKWMYKPCFQNHPCTIWAGVSRRNLIWLIDLAYNLCLEYNVRYGKIHKCYGMILLWKNLVDHLNIPDGRFTNFALAVTPELKEKYGTDYNLIESINCYREYYIQEKSYLAIWKNSEVPKWFSENNPNNLNVKK
jgi:hypothetical protein